MKTTRNQTKRSRKKGKTVEDITSATARCVHFVRHGSIFLAHQNSCVRRTDPRRASICQVSEAWDLLPDEGGKRGFRRRLVAFLNSSVWLEYGPQIFFWERLQIRLFETSRDGIQPRAEGLLLKCVGVKTDGQLSSSLMKVNMRDRTATFMSDFIPSPSHRHSFPKLQ